MTDNSIGKATAPGSPLLEVSEEQRQQDEWRQQLLQLEKEIQALKSVLAVKSAEASELRGHLGISSMKEFKEDVKQSYKVLQESEVVQKTNAAFKSIGEFASKKIDEIKNSSTMRSLEDKVGGAYSNVKDRLSTSGLFTSRVADGTTIPTADSNLYSPTTTVDHGYEVVNEFSLPGKDEVKTFPSGVVKKN